MLTLFVSFFVLACERIFIKTHSIKNRCVIGPENMQCLQVRPPCSFTPVNFTGWGSEGVNGRSKFVNGRNVQAVKHSVYVRKV